MNRDMISIEVRVYQCRHGPVLSLNHGPPRLSRGEAWSSWGAENGGRLIELMRRFSTEEAGQDLIEYTLLMAFVALASASLFVNAGSSVSKVWSISNSTLSTAAVKASS